MGSAPSSHLFGTEGAEARAGAMLVAYRLAGVSALEGHYARDSVSAQFGGVCVYRTSRRTGWDGWAWAATCTGTALNFRDLGVTSGDDDWGYRWAASR